MIYVSDISINLAIKIHADAVPQILAYSVDKHANASILNLCLDIRQCSNFYKHPIVHTRKYRIKKVTLIKEILPSELGERTSSVFPTCHT